MAEDWPDAALRSLDSLVLARVDDVGRVLWCNAGFARLLPAPPEAGVTLVAGLFIQPDFAALTHAPANTDGRVYDGLLTFGNYLGQTRSLQARLWRQGNELRLLAEHDIDALELLNQSVLELNQRHARSQAELAQSHFQLKQSAQALQQSVAELKQSNARLAQTQSQLVQSEKLASIGLLAAGVAHEINNPLGYLTSNLATLRKYVRHCLDITDAYDQIQRNLSVMDGLWATVTLAKRGIDWDYIREDVMPLLDESQEGLDRVKQTVRALQDFARPNAPQQWRDEDLHQGLEATLRVFWGQLQQRCELHKQWGELPLVQCVLAQLNQVFLNLLINAAQAMDGAGVITVRTGQQGDLVWVEVADNGRGMSEQEQAHIFEPFYTTHAPGQGAGLGLSVAHGIVAQHHGRIDVTSAPGRGATFRVWLPVQQPSAPTTEHCESDAR